MSLLFLHNTKTRVGLVGFTLVELLVSISILILVLITVVSGQRSFEESVLLRSQAYDIALSLREVQLSAISAQSDGSGGFRDVTGAHFDTANSGVYHLFRDANGDNMYTQSTELLVSVSGLDDRFAIESIAALSADSASTISAVHVLFQRPNFDANFFDGAGNEISASAVEVVLRAVGTTGNQCGLDVRTVSISKSGQISVLDC